MLFLLYSACLHWNRTLESDVRPPTHHSKLAVWVHNPNPLFKRKSLLFHISSVMRMVGLFHPRGVQCRQVYLEYISRSEISMTLCMSLLISIHLVVMTLLRSTHTSPKLSPISQSESPLPRRSEYFRTHIRGSIPGAQTRHTHVSLAFQRLDF